MPSAALDVASTYIPLGRTLIGKVLGPQVEALLKKGGPQAAEAAERFAKESLFKTVAKGTGVGLAVEAPTEIAQQMLERAQAGLSLTGEDALKEYVDTAYQAGLLAPIGAGGRLADRGAARQEVEAARQATEAEAFKTRQEAEKQAAEALDAQRQTPEYAQEVAQKYAALMEQRRELQAKVRTKVEKDDLIGLADKKDAAREFAELNNSDEFKSTSKEFRRVLPVLRQIEDQQAQEQAQQALQAQQEQEARTKESEFAGPGRQQMLPGMEEAAQIPAPPTEAEPSKALEFAQKQQELEQLLTAHQQQESEAAAQGDTDALKQLRTQREMLLNEQSYVTKQLELLGGYTAPGSGAIAIQKKLDKAQADLKNLAGAGYDPVVADKLVAKIDEYTAQLQKAGGVQQAFGFGTKAAPASREQSSEQLPEFASRLRQQAQAERMAGVERPSPEAVVAEREALKRIGGRPSPEMLPGQMQDLFGATTEQYPSAALGQMQQELTGQERTYTGEETAPPKVPQRVKGTGEFKLFPRQGAPVRPAEYSDISTRLASVLARSDLTPEAYSLLSRIESTLPSRDVQVEAAPGTEGLKKGPGEGAVGKRTTAPQSLYALVDQQLARIERGEEGVARKGAGKPGVLQAFPVTGGRADVAPPTAPAETAPGVKPGYARAAAASEEFGPERQAVTAREAARAKRANVVGPETIRGPSAQAAPLSFQAELEPLVSQFEKARESSQEGQLGLFEKQEKKLGAIKATPAAYQRLINSPYVRKLVKDIRTKKAAVDVRKLAAEAKRTEATVKEEQRRAAQDEARAARDKEIAARLERTQGEQFSGTRYEPISEAERLRRETEGLPRITSMDQEQLLAKEGEKLTKGKKDPLQVLGGYRSTIARLEKLVRRRQTASRAFAEQDIANLKTAYEQLDKKYKETKSAEARAVIARDLESAETKYNNAKNAITEQRFVFKGQKAVENQLSEAYVKEEWLSKLISEGKIEVKTDKKTRTLLSAQAKKALQEQRERAFAKQKAEEGPAPATTGEALTPSQVKKARAAEKTVYSSKGIGAEGQAKLKEQQTLAAETKEALGKDSLNQLAATATQGPALKEAVDVEDSAAAVMQNISKTTTSDIARAVADKLKLLLGSTQVRIVKDLRDQNGNAVYGQAAVDGSFIALDAKYGLNETTAIHEGVHASLERILRMPESQLTDRQRAAKRELEALFDAIKNDDTIVNENAKTDLSEFVSEALSDGALQVQLRAKPWTLKNAWESLKNGILKMLGIDTPKDMLEATLASADVLMSKVVRPTEADATIQVVNRPRYAAGLADAGRITDALVASQKSLWQKIKPNLFLGLRTQFVDKLAPLEKIANTSMEALKGTQMMYYLRMYEQRTNFTSQSISNGVPQLVEKTRKDGRKEWVIESTPGATIKDVVDILTSVSKQAGSPDAANRLFTLYLAAKRAERVGIQALNFGGKVTQADLDTALKEIAAVPALEAAFERARDKYNDYNKNLLTFAVQTGSIPKDVAASLLAAKDYIPFYRVREGAAELLIGNETPIRIGSLKDSPHLQELVGGDEAIFDFLTSSVQNTSMLLDMSLKNIATKNAMYELADSNLAKIGRGTGPKNAVDFTVDGKPHYAVIDTDAIGIPSDLLVKGLAGIPTMLPTVTRIMGAPARLLRRAITASPVYMARQIFRDSVAATMLSGADMTPILSTLRQLGKESELTKRGITGGQVFTGTNEDISRLLSEMQSGRPVWAQAFAKLEAMSMEADAATRRAQYNSYIKQGLSEMEATFMALESMNFNKRGVSPSMHLASTLIPFMNAQIQGLDVMYKAFAGKMPFNERLKLREKMWTRGMVMFGMSMWYAASMQDDEAYKNATPEQKYGNWFVRIPGIEEPIRVPIPFELGYVFKAIPEAIVNTLINEKGGEEATKAFKQIGLQLIPGGTSYGIPQAVKPLIELGLGKSFYTGRDLESAAEKAREPGTRYRENTSELAKQVGEITGVSPIQLEYLISSYTGSMGLALLQTLNFAMPAEGPEKAFKRMSEQPLVGTLFQPNDAGGIINATYERMNEINQIKATFDNYIKTGQKDKAREYLNENAAQLAQASLAGNFREKMGELTAYEKVVRSSTRSAQDKRELLDRVRQLKIKYATSVRAAFDRTTPQ